VTTKVLEEYKSPCLGNKTPGGQKGRVVGSRYKVMGIWNDIRGTRSSSQICHKRSMGDGIQVLRGENLRFS
jgi:hypothetical protein